MKSGFNAMLICVLMGVLGTSAQTLAQDVLDGVYEKVATEEKEIIPYDHIREADVFWSKRIWRVIDVEEKMNHSFKYPQAPLIEVIHEAAKTGEMTVYDNRVENGDQFIEPMPIEDVKGIGYSLDTSFQISAFTQNDTQVVIENELTWDKIKKYQLKEDWFFDEETSTFQVRIIGIAPVRESFDEMGNYRGDELMYWVYYPHVRDLLVKHEVFNGGNDAVRMSWDDLFEMRMFSSYIIKESNVHDRKIQEYATGVDALLESDRIKNEMFMMEHDLWTY